MREGDKERSKNSPYGCRRCIRRQSAFSVISMDPWGRSSFSDKIVSWLVEDGLLRPVTNAVQPEWIVLSNENEPNPPTGYVVSFTHSSSAVVTS
jgi:hypothetical protein